MSDTYAPESDEPLEWVAAATIVYLGPVAPHWEIRGEHGVELLTADVADLDGFERIARERLWSHGDPVHRTGASRGVHLAARHPRIDVGAVYLGFGLLIGIAGLGVVMVRAARERRHEIGTLRAMGLQGRVVSRAFLIEAFFIAGGGVIIGTSLALVTAYQVVVNSSAFSIAGMWAPISSKNLPAVRPVP